MIHAKNIIGLQVLELAKKKINFAIDYYGNC